MLEDRVVLVTGAGSGLGRATALAAAARGATVVAVDVDGGSAVETAHLAARAAAAGTVEALTVDVTDAEAVEACVTTCSERYGARFDAVVSNAGTDRGADLVDIEDAQWHRVFGVNVHGPMYLGRAFVRHLRQHEGRLAGPGDLVCIVSISALTVGAGAGAYNASKAAMLKLAEVMQTEARERGWPVRVCAVNPAAMDTPMMEQWGLPPERMMDPATVAGLVLTAMELPSEVVLHEFVLTRRSEYYPR